MILHKHHFIQFPDKEYSKKHMMCSECGWGMPMEFAQHMLDQGATCDPALLKVKQYTSADSGLTPDKGEDNPLEKTRKRK